MTSLVLLGLSIALAAAAPGWLVRAAWVYRSPRLGVLAWQAIALTLLISTVTAALIVVMPWHPAHDAACEVWRLCLDAVAGAHGGVAQVVAWTGLAVLAAGAVRIVVAAVPAWRAARHWRRHAAMARLVGQHRPDLGAIVLDRPDPAVYLVPGRVAKVILTTGAMARLGTDELAAVLAHERAHVHGKHHRPLALANLLRTAFPKIGPFDEAHRQISRLVEMCADDRARAEHSALALARALTALAIPAGPPGALAGGGGEALERMHRLMCPPAPLPLRVRAVAVAFLLALPLAPLAVLLAMPAVPALHAGLPVA